MNIGFLPPPDLIERRHVDRGLLRLGHIMTAIPPIHAIPAVVAAAPGIATYNDLPLPNARGDTDSPLGRNHRVLYPGYPVGMKMD